MWQTRRNLAVMPKLFFCNLSAILASMLKNNMLARIPDTPFGTTTYIRSILERRARKDPVCGGSALSCATKDADLHFCCSAEKIQHPSLEAPLSWEHFVATLCHYGINMGKADTKDAYVDYLAEACTSDKSDDLIAAGDAFTSLSDAAEEAAEAGDLEKSRKLADSAHEKAQEMMGIARKAREEAEMLAEAL